MKGRERKTGRYDTSGLIEAQFEPGSRRRVLRNLLGIKSKREMDRIEARAQVRALLELTKTYGRRHRFTSADICGIHRIWLGGYLRLGGKVPAGLPSLDFSHLKGHKRNEYYAAARSGLDRDYKPMEYIFIDVIAKTLQKHRT